MCPLSPSFCHSLTHKKKTITQIHFCPLSRGGSSDTVLKYDVEYIGSSMSPSQSGPLPSANQIFQDHLVNHLIPFFFVGLWAMGLIMYGDQFLRLELTREKKRGERDQLMILFLGQYSSNNMPSCTR